jgi:carbonic anhydrase/acetyltransferase-like protein (isoleucine patch superfamily)
MPINNITRINTVDEWRIQTNQSANAINNIETGNFNKTSGTLTISNTGALSITAQGTSLTVANNVLLSNTVTIGRNVELGSREIATGNLTVGANVFIYGVGTALFVANNATVNTNLQVTQNVRTNNIVANVNVTVSGTTQSGNLLVDSIAIITGNTTAGNLTTANATSTGSLRVNDTTETSSNISGAAIIYGGVGVSKSAFISGNVTVKGDAAGAVNNTVLLSLGSLASNSAGNLYIYAANTANGGANGSLTVQGNSNITGNLRLGSGLVSSSKTTGSLIVEGGVGVSANVHATDFIATNSLVADNARITANVTANSFVGTGSLVVNNARITANATFGETTATTINATNARISGNANVSSITASNSLVADNARITANVTANSFVGTGSLVVDNARITANVTANSFVGTGSLVVDSARITANVTANSFVATGTLVADNARITANATFGETTATTINATNARISGNANVANVTISNSLVADNARITANVTANSFVGTGSLVVDNARITSNATFTETTATTINATNARISDNANVSSITASNSLVADNARITANVTANSFVATGTLVADNARITANVTANSFVATGTLVADNARITSNLSAVNLYASSVYDNGNRVARTVSATAPISATLNSSTGALAISHDVSGVTATTYGNSVNVASFTVNDRGHITSAQNVAIRTGSTTETGILQLTDSITSTSTTTAATANSINTAVLLFQANVGAARIADVAAAQANVGAARITDTANAQANSGAGDITVTNAYQANVGAARIAITNAYQANVGAANISAFANHVKLTSTSQTITGSLAITGGVSVGGDFTITGQQLVDTNRIKLMATTKQTIGAGYDYITINRVNATATLDGTSDTINMSAHGFSMGQNVMFTNISAASVGSPVTGLSNNTIYRVLVLNASGAVAVGGTNSNFFKVTTSAGYNSASPATSTPINFANNGTTLTFDQDNKDADLRWSEVSKVWEFRDVGNLDDSTAYSRILTANLMSNSISLDSSSNVATSNAVRTAVLSGQANVGAGLISITNAYQANVGQLRLDTQNANTSLAANIGAARIADAANAQANSGVALITARADIDTANTKLKNYADSTFLPKTGGTISSDLTISGSLTVSGSITTINTEEINLADNEIVLNSNHTTNMMPTQNAGIIINRGNIANSPNVYIRYDEGNDYWVLRDNSGQFIVGTTANAGAGDIAVTSAYQANVGAGLITKVNKSGDTMTGALNVAINTAATSTITGALIVGGGAGIAGSAWAANLVSTGPIYGATGVFDTGTRVASAITASSAILGSLAANGRLYVSHEDTSTQENVDNSAGNVIQDVTLDGFGHITALGSVNLDDRYYTEAESDSRFVNVTGDTMTGALTITDNTAATSTSTGSLKVSGGVGVAGNVWAANVVSTGPVYDTGTRVASAITASSAILGSLAANGRLYISHQDTSTQENVDNSAGNVIQDVTLDGFGHITALGSVNLDDRYYTETESDNRFVNVTGDTMTGALNIATTTAATSTATGALIVGGGVGGGGIGVAGNVWAANLVSTGPVYGATGVFDTGVRVASAIVASSSILGSLAANGKLYISHDDTSTQASVDNSAGNVIQDVTLDTNGHITALGSVNLDDRYYTETEADSRFVNVTGDTMTGALNIANATVATSRITGALIVAGGAGVSGDLYADQLYSTALNIEAGGFIEVLSTDASTSRTTGSIVTSGGIGVSGNAWAANLVSTGPVYGATGVFDGGVRVARSVNPQTGIVSSLAANGNLSIGHADTSTLSGALGPTGPFTSGTTGVITSLTIDGFGHITDSAGATVSLSNHNHDGTYLSTGGGTLTGALTITDTTAATSTSTGSLKVSGGVGVAGNVWAANVVSTGPVYGATGVFDGGVRVARSVSGTAPITASLTNGALSISHDTSGVVAATHGSATEIPVFTVNDRGHITTVTNTAISLGTTGTPQFASLGVGTAASGTTGEIRATGDITSGYSDDKLKDKIGNIENAIDKVVQLAGFYYQPNELAKSLGYDDSVQVGVSAQEVQKVLPEVVVPAPIGSQFLTVKYDRMIPLLIEAIKELKSEIEDIKKKI